MKTFSSSLSASNYCKKGSVLTLGNYDGVHLGHQAIIHLLLSEAKRRKLPSILYTFEPHPVSVLAPSITPPLINTLEQKIELLKNQKLIAAIFEKFTLRFSMQTPKDFFQKIIVERLRAKFVIVGYDFTFGKQRLGNIETLELLCGQHGIDVKIMTPQMIGKTLVSSSLVRKQVLKGSMTEAHKLLGRPLYIDGIVVKGKQRGGLMGIHTANLKTNNPLIPPDGVYATQVRVGKKLLKSATNIGLNPTFGNTERTIETHIFHFNQKINGKKVRLFFVDRIRDEIRFDSPRKLAEQIQKDIIVAKRMLK